MTRTEAQRRYDSLRRMTTARGCTIHEAATAARLAHTLAKRYGLEDVVESREWRADFAARYTRAEQRAATRFKWEYRRCGKQRCHCASRGDRGHGPYRYSKKREGRKVRSIYLGL